jgi:formylglycine-generating enzyme required for sulfatase activity
VVSSAGAPSGMPRLVLDAPAPMGPFWIARTETSNSQYRRFVTATGYKPQGDWVYRDAEAALPAVHLTYDDAAAFCTWIGGRLPTKGEFEWAGRGPHLHPFPWGPVADLQRYAGGGTPSGGKAQPVDSLPEGASWCGAMHLVGNVSEWCSPPFPNSAVHRTTPYAYGDDADRAVLRGGSYVHGGDACRPNWRYIGKRSGSGPLDGFRPVIPVMPALQSK